MPPAEKERKRTSTRAEWLEQVPFLRVPEKKRQNAKGKTRRKQDRGLEGAANTSPIPAPLKTSRAGKVKLADFIMFITDYQHPNDEEALFSVIEEGSPFLHELTSAVRADVAFTRRAKQRRKFTVWTIYHRKKCR